MPRLAQLFIGVISIIGDSGCLAAVILVERFHCNPATGTSISELLARSIQRNPTVDRIILVGYQLNGDIYPARFLVFMSLDHPTTLSCFVLPKDLG